jgi:DNA-binding transcriptional LysR family regulator
VRNLSFRHVETIYSVILTGSVTGAATRLRVTQPAVSNLIKDAEGRVGFSLFERRTGRLVPTSRAQAIFTEIERSFSGLDVINDLCNRLQGEVRQTVTIASTPAFAAAILPRVINAYKREMKDVRFSIIARRAEEVQALVASLKVDVGFAVDTPATPGICRELLSTPRLMCMLPGNHSLTRKEFIDASDICHDPMITFSRIEGYDAVLALAFAGAECMPPSVVECPAALAAVAMVEAGIGFTLLDPIQAHLFRHSSVAMRPFTPAVERGLWAYWVQSQEADRQRRRIVELAKQFCEETLSACAENWQRPRRATGRRKASHVNAPPP